ncbi:MAG: FtsX-like permease family protein [Vicinamibacterales bacterium]
MLGCIAFLLSAVGLHGLVAQTVTERRREFGIRMAIGADRTQIMRPVLRQAATLASVGLGAGLVLAWWSGHLVDSRLFGITSRNPSVYAAAAVLMALVVAAATSGPARAATRVDPVEVLRVE